MSTKQAGKSLKVGILLQLVNLVPQFLIPRILIIYYGSDINGMISSITQIMTYLTVFESGIILATIYELYNPIINNDRNLLNVILRENKLFLNKVFIIYNCAIIVFSVVYPLIVGEQLSFTFVAVTVLVIGLSRSLEYLLCSEYRVLLSADQKLYIVYGTQAIGMLLQSIFICTALLLNWGIIIAFSGSCISFIVRYITMKYYCERHYKGFVDKSIGKKLYDKNIKNIKQTKDVLVHQIAYMVSYNTDILLLTIMTSLKEVSIYAVYKLLFSIVKSISNIITNTFTPYFGNLSIDNKIKTLDDYNTFELMIFALIFSIFAGFILLLEPFILIYTSGQEINYVFRNITVMFMICGLLTHIRIPIGVMVQASGSFKETKTILIIEASINLILSIIGIKIWGLPGALAGTAFSSLYRSIFISSYVFKNVLKISPFCSIKRLIINSFLAFIAITIIKNVLHLNYDTLTSFTINGIISFVIIFTIIITGNYFFDKKASKKVLTMLKSFIK